MKVLSAVVFGSLAVVAGPVRAEAGWRLGLGPAYVSGIDDVTDLYERNMRRDGFVDVDVDLLAPIGVAFSADYHWSSGVRVDLGLGPIFVIAGDVDHVEVPLSATVGYSFLPDSNVSPYVRAGLVLHLVDGEYYNSTEPGVLAAVGVDFARMSVARIGLEVALDTSKVEFDLGGASCPVTPVMRPCSSTSPTEDLRTYDIVASVYVKF